MGPPSTVAISHVMIQTAKPGADDFVGTWLLAGPTIFSWPVNLPPHNATPRNKASKRAYIDFPKGLIKRRCFLNCVFPALQVLSGNWMAKAFHVMNLTAGSCAVFVKCWRSNATCHGLFHGRIWEDHLLVPVMVVLGFMFCFFTGFGCFVGSRQGPSDKFESGGRPTPVDDCSWAECRGRAGGSLGQSPALYSCYGAGMHWQPPPGKIGSECFFFNLPAKNV